MAPKTPSSRSRKPSTEKPQKKPSSKEKEDPKQESDSDDETEEEGSSSEEEEKQDQQNLKTTKTPNPVPKSESKSTDGSDSETESEGSPSNYKIQPVLKPHKSTAKRPNQEDGVGGSSKKKSRTEEKKTKTEEKKTKTEEKKPPSTPGAAGCITRVWSDEDEIAVLNGMIDYRAQNGANADMGAFYDFIKGKLQADFTSVQLKTKIRRLRDRFNNALKKCENGADPVFSRPHEDISFELSKKIWGPSVGNSNGSNKKKIESSKKKGVAKVKETETVKEEKEAAKEEKEVVKEEKVTANEKEVVNVKEENNVEEVDFWSKYPSLNVSFAKILGNFPSFAVSEPVVEFMKKRVSLIGSDKAKQLDEKWRQLMVKEMELNYKMLALMTEQVGMALDQ